MRKRCRRKVIEPKPPRGLRPMLLPSTQRTLEIYHLQNLDAIARGQATHDVLWEWAGGVLTWARVAEVLGVGLPEMHEQLELATAVLERFRATGRIGFTGPQYQLAKTGVMVMDQLACQVDQAAAEAAAAWSQQQVDRITSGQADGTAVLRGAAR